MRTSRFVGAFLPLAALGLCLPAQGQVLITEVQPDLVGQDDAEWVELENIGTASVSLGGWSINDYTGTSSAGETTTRWMFPVTASIAPGQVIVVSKQALAFRATFSGRNPTFEMGIGSDDSAVPNVQPSSGNSFTLNNRLSQGGAGDGVILRNAAGDLVSGVEFGSVDRSIPGLPVTTYPAPGETLTRVDNQGSSAIDFRVSTTPGPFVGFRGAGGPAISNPRARPRHPAFGGHYVVTASVTDSDGVRRVDIYLATATSSAGPAVSDYLALPMALTGSVARFSAPVENLGAGLAFNDPATFHERYLRYFLRAEDQQGTFTIDPVGAEELAANTHFRPQYVQNVVPSQPTPIASAREPLANGLPRWTGHSVRVQGVALVSPEIINPGRTQFALQDASGKAITVFENAELTFSFEPGARIEVVGVLGDFLGLTQITNTSSVTVLAGTSTVSMTSHTIAQVLADPEALESQLIEVSGVDFVTPRANWPEDSAAPRTWNVPVSDGTGTLTVRVTNATDLFGQPAPQFGFDIVGVLAQRGSEWQLFPRSSADITPRAAPPSDGGVGDATTQDGSAFADAQAGADSGSAADGGVNPRADAAPVAKVDAGEGPQDNGGCGCSAVAGTQSRSPWTGMVALGLLLAFGAVRKRQS